jgi:hypothetical protein
VRSVAEAHGGTVMVRSILGQGSEFTVRLPAIEEHEAARARSNVQAIDTLFGNNRGGFPADLPMRA